MSGSGLENLPDGREWWEAITNIREWSGCPTRYPGVVGRLSLMSGRCWEDLPDIWEWSRDHPGFPVVVGWPFRMSESGRDALPNVREWL